MVERLLAALPQAMSRWQATDPILAGLAQSRPPTPVWGRRGSAFAELVGALVHQQVSVAAGRIIFGRVRTACDGRVTPDRILALGGARLRACGLSRQKRDYIMDLARRVRARDVNLRGLSRLSDAEAIEALTRVRGIGDWTAKMFLIFHLERPDVLAADDLGLQIAATQIYGVPAKRARAFLERKAPAWSPYASLASIMLWHARRTNAGATPKPSRTGRAPAVPS